MVCAASWFCDAGCRTFGFGRTGLIAYSSSRMVDSGNCKASGSELQLTQSVKMFYTVEKKVWLVKLLHGYYC